MNATFTSLSTHLNEADKNDSFDSCDEEIQDLFSSGYSKFYESSMDSNSMDSISYISANNFSERMYSVYNRNRPNLNFRKMRKVIQRTVFLFVSRSLCSPLTSLFRSSIFIWLNSTFFSSFNRASAGVKWYTYLTHRSITLSLFIWHCEYLLL